MDIFRSRLDYRFPLDRDLPGRTDLFPILYDLVHVTGWDAYDLHVARFLGWICSMQILQNLSQRQELGYLDHDLSKV